MITERVTDDGCSLKIGLENKPPYVEVRRFISFCICLAQDLLLTQAVNRKGKVIPML